MFTRIFYSLVRGTWNTWGAWSECSASCDAGITQRARNCSTPSPSDAGDDCIGEFVQKAPCKLFDCPRKIFFLFWNE